MLEHWMQISRHEHIAAALAFVLSSCAAHPSAASAQTLPASTCTITDGDTIRCGDERIRLLAIDAPELSACRKGRVCAPGDGQASKRALEAMTQGRDLRIERHGKDRFGRTLAYVWAGRVNLSCAMVEAGQAVWVEKWNSGGRGC